MTSTTTTTATTIVTVPTTMVVTVSPMKIHETGDDPGVLLAEETPREAAQKRAAPGLVPAGSVLAIAAAMVILRRRLD